MSNQTKSGAYDNLFSTLTISSLVAFISTLSYRRKKRDSIQADILDSTRYVIAYTISIILEEKTVAWSKNYSVAVNEWTWFSFHITHTHLVQSVGKILNFPLQKKMLQYCIFLVKGSTVNEFQNYILVHDMTENWFVTWLTVWFAFQKKIADPRPDRVGGLKRRGDNKLYLRFIFICGRIFTRVRCVFSGAIDF